MSFSDGTRLMIKVHMPGDMLGSPSLAFTKAIDSLVALSPVVVTTVSQQDLGQLFESSPRLAAILFLISQEERAFLMDRLASVGRTSTPGKIAMIILQLHERVLRNNPDGGDTFDVPLTQRDLADLAGVTDVHVNRSLQALRAEGIIRWERGQVTVLNRASLRVMADLPERVLARDQRWLPARR